MEVATWLLLVIGILGAADIALYHAASHGIRSHPDSRAELVIHSLRGPTYATLFLFVPNFALRGAYFWALVGWLIVDVAISIVDFAMERESRRFFGGLPSGEYVLHVVIAMVFGAFVASIFFGAGHWGFEPTAISWQPAAVPAVLRGLLAVMAAGVFYSGVLDALAAIRLTGVPRRATSKK
ncbi:MAG: hypothetical protein L0228_17470 [Planctomycetes bacterium]|nr:hypothetical protein [Planctomycetota bacterium]